MLWKSWKKLSTTLFFRSRGTDWLYTYLTARCCFWGIAWLLILFVVVVVFLFSSFSEMLPPPLPTPSPYAVAARQIPTYRTCTYLTCRHVADLYYLPWVPTLVMKPLMNTMMFNCRSGAYNDASRVRRVCVCMCNCVCVCVCVCQTGRVGVFFYC